MIEKFNISTHYLHQEKITTDYRKELNSNSESIETDQPQIHACEVSQFNQFLPKLPTGYGFKGGAARSILIRATKWDPEYTPRDIDIVCCDQSKFDQKLADELAAEYMPADFKKGFGVEIIDEHYFETRDFIFNEVLMIDNKLLFSQNCLTDILSKNITICPHKKTDLNHINENIKFKTVRFASELTGANIVDRDIFLEKTQNPYYIAKNLDKALEKNIDLGWKYFLKLKELNQIPSHIDSISTLIDYLNVQARDYPKKYSFKHA